MFAAGDANYFDLARPALEAMVERIVFCGGVGQGQVAKLVNNLLAHSLTVLVEEAPALGVRSGASIRRRGPGLTAGYRPRRSASHEPGQTRL